MVGDNHITQSNADSSQDELAKGVQQYLIALGFEQSNQSLYTHKVIVGKVYLTFFRLCGVAT